MSVRQKQLSRLSPRKVIELSYLCALLEQLSGGSSSNKVDCITQFLKDIVEIVPIESIEYAANSGKPYVAGKCREVITTLGLQSLLNAQQNSESSSSITAGIICDLALGSLYSITSDNEGFQSPIKTLELGIDKLKENRTASLPPGATSRNTEMLETVNQIRTTVLALCISLLVSFMNQQSVVIPLLAPGSSHIGKEGLHVSTSALAGLGLEEIHSILKDSNKTQMLVKVKMYDEREGKETDQDEKDYADKLYFILQCLSTNSIKCGSYSLERQLVSACGNRAILLTEPDSFSNLVKEWKQKFRSTILTLVASPHRPLIARWLKWSLMVHNLREELAKYTAVGVVGLVNSGKSTLVESLFDIKVYLFSL